MTELLCPRCSRRAIALATLMIGSWSSCAPVAWAQERGIPTYLYLCDATTLEGWEQQAARQADWTLVDGTLRGNDRTGQLSVSNTFGWVTWKFQWRGAPGSVLDVILDEAPTGEPITIQLASDGPSGRILRGDREAAPGRVVGIEPNGQLVEITLERGFLVVKISESEVSRAPVSAGRRSGFALRVAKGSADISPILFQESGGRPIFDGRSLAGFYTDGDAGAWSVEDGTIHARPQQSNYLRSQELFGNFTFSVDYRIAKGGNSGIGIRTPVDGWPSSDGMEIQILDEPPDHPVGPQSNGGIYRNMPPFRRNDAPFPNWNHLVIKADGPMLSVWVNGRMVNHANLARHSVLRHRPNRGWLGLQNHGSPTEFRNLVVIDAPDGDGFSAWTEPGEFSPAQQVLGPALDPAELLVQRSAATSVSSGTNPGESDKGGELLNLKGPGALTRIFRTNASGSVAFYFDDEPKPRIDSSWFHLPEKLPVVASSETTIYTYLPFQKSLRIVQQGARPAEYQFGHVRFPKAKSLASEIPPLSGDDRGWFGALSYMRQHHQHGTLPYEPYLTKSTKGPQDLDAEKSAVLVDVSGSGQTRWLRLYPKRDELLATRSLWLDIFVDGEERPSVSAPARLLYAGLAPENGKQRPGTFLMTQKETGFFHLLPIPFTNGLKIVGRNTGTAPLEGVGVEAAVHRLPVHAVPAARLCSQYIDSEPGPGAPWLNIDVRGTLVCLSVESPSGDLGTIDQLILDGAPQKTWKDMRFAAFLGRDTPPTDHNSGFDGSAGPISWHHFLMDELTFQSSLRIDRKPIQPDPTLVLYYAIF